MGAAPSIAIFVAGAAFGAALADPPDIVKDALDSVCRAAEEVMGYLRPAFEKATAAAAKFVSNGGRVVMASAAAAMGYLRTVATSAFEKLKEAAETIREKVVKLVRHLKGGESAAAAAREVDRAAAGRVAWRDVVSAALARAGPLLGSASEAARAAGLVLDMLALLDAVLPALGAVVPSEARACIWTVVAAAGICFDVIPSAAAAAAANSKGA